MAKKVTGYIKLQIPAGKATPAPPVGPALGQHGVNICLLHTSYYITVLFARQDVPPIILGGFPQKVCARPGGTGRAYIQNFAVLPYFSETFCFLTLL